MRPERLGTWALVAGAAGLLMLMAPAALLTVVLGAVLSVAAVVVGLRGAIAHSRGLAPARASAIAGIVLGMLGILMWGLAILGMLLL